MTLGVLAVCWSSAWALVALWSSICALNVMTRATPVTARLAYILLGVGAGAVLLAPAYLGRTPSAAELLLVTGLSALAGFHHRLRPGRGRRSGSA